VSDILKEKDGGGGKKQEYLVKGGTEVGEDNFLKQFGGPYNRVAMQKRVSPGAADASGLQV